MGSFYATTCKTDCVQILYKFCKYRISVPNIVHQLTLSLRCKYCKIHSRSNFQHAINSIRRSAADCKPMTSVFYDVIRLESVHGRSNMLIEGHFWQFWGNLNPKMLSAIVCTLKGTSLRHSACFEPSYVKFHTRVTSVGESEKKIKIQKERPYISRISSGAPLGPIGINFVLRVRLVDIINSAKFYGNRLKWFGFCEGSKFDHSYWIAMLPLTLCELLFTLWYSDMTSWIHSSNAHLVCSSNWICAVMNQFLRSSA